MSLWETVISEAQKRSPSRGLRLKTDVAHTKEWKQTTSFEGLPSVPNLRALDVRNSSIESFYGAQVQPNLERFNCLETPLAQYKHLALMSLIAFGKSVVYVNGSEVDMDTRRLANSVKSDLRPLICNDRWVIINTDPIKMLHIVTRKRKTYFSEKPKTDADESEVKEIYRKQESSDSEEQEEPVKEVEPSFADNFSVASYVGTDDEIRAYLRQLTAIQVEERTRTRQRQGTALSVTSSMVSRDVESILSRTEVQNQYAESVVDRRPGMFRSPDRFARSVVAPSEYAKQKVDELYPPAPVHVNSDYLDDGIQPTRSPEKRREVDVSSIKRHVRSAKPDEEWDRGSIRSRKSRDGQRSTTKSRPRMLSESGDENEEPLSEDEPPPVWLPA